MIHFIAFDADDTLWHTEPLYTQVKDRFIELFSNGRDPARMENILERIEIDNLRYYGYGIKSFTLSMLEAAAEITGGQIASNEIQQIIQFSKQMLDADLQFLDHVVETLAELSGAYHLMLITKGDLFEQERKVTGSGLAKYFRYVEIVNDKTVESYRALLEKYQIDPRSFLMVGNSLRSDILPVVTLGGNAVYIPYEHTWSHEKITARALEKHEYYELEHLGLLPALVRQLNSAS
jgi:putative hydrolase of the HAD superfamily